MTEEQDPTPEASGIDGEFEERRSGCDRRSDSDRRSDTERRVLADRRGSGLRTPAPPGTVRPYGFRTFEERRSGEDRRSGVERRGPDDRRWDRGVPITLTSEELDALLNPSDD